MTNEQLRWFQSHFIYLWLFGVGWVVALATVNALKRRKRGLAVMMPKFTGAAFEERWCSGGRGLLWAQNCAWVVLLRDRLVTGLHFPFGLLFPRRWLLWAGLDNEIALSDIFKAELVTNMAGDAVRIAYRAASGSEYVDLVPGRSERLLEILRELGTPERSAVRPDRDARARQ